MATARRQRGREDMTRETSRTCVEEEDTETRCQACMRVFIIGTKRFITFLFSHVGLTCLVVGYTILGGLIFKEIELPEEKLTRQAVADAKQRYLQDIIDFYESSDAQTILGKTNWDAEINKRLRSFEVELHAFTKLRDWDGRFEGDDYQWSFAHSLLYSVTVITTIGYGNITPKTTGGRLFTILYGSLGIPLTMLCLGNIGNLMAETFRLIYRCACVNMTYQYIKLKRRRLRQRFVNRLHIKAHGVKAWALRNQNLMTSVLHIHDWAANDREHGESKPVSDITGMQQDDTLSVVSTNRRHSDSTVTRLNHRPHMPRTQRKHSLGGRTHEPTDKQLYQQAAIRDLKVIPEEESSDVEVRIADLEPLASDRKTLTSDNRHTDNSASPTISSLSLHDFEDDEIMLKTRLKATRDMVPISMCLLLVAGYILVGALIFMSWEDGWNFLVGFYFCFITLTTIGFGDFVPGMGEMEDESRRVFCVVYLLLGMALIAMSFHLIQEEVRHKCRKMAHTISLLVDKISRLMDNCTSDETS